MNEERDRLDETARRAREVFDASVDALDDETRARLGRARFAAVAATERRARPSPWLRWVPAVAVASTGPATTRPRGAFSIIEIEFYQPVNATSERTRP